MRAGPAAALLWFGATGSGAAAAPTNPATTASTVHEQRVQTAWNRHRAGGADNRRTDARLVVIREADGVVRAFESGTDRDFSMSQGADGPQTREEIRRWATDWVGTWAAAGSEGTVTLRREAQTCAISLSWDRRPPEARPCPDAPSVMTLRCAAWRGDGDGLRARGWRCLADGSTMGAGRAALLPWYLADRCVKVSRGPGGRLHLGDCPPDPGPPTP